MFLKQILILLFSLSAWAVFAQQKQEQIIVFLQEKSTDVEEDFKENILPSLEKYAADEHIEIIVKKVEEGIPKEVFFTPAVVFQNKLGRSFYTGRLNQVSKVKNFIRTSRLIPQKGKGIPKKNILIWQNERMKIAAPIKITELNGDLPEDFDMKEFLGNANAAAQKGTDNFKLVSSTTLNRMDRSFYMDMYPHRGKDNQLYITLALFSQFHCVEPIYTNEDNPIKGSYDDYKALFHLATAQLEKEIIKRMISPERGDGFDIISQKISVKPWSSLGVGLPTGNRKNVPIAYNIPQERPRRLSDKKNWQFLGKVDEDTPIIQFSFQAPLDFYTGEVDIMEGQLQLEDSFDITSGKGEFRIPVEKLTMGDPDLDAAIHYLILKAEKYPEAVFNINKIISQSKGMMMNQVTPFTMEGNLELRGIKQPALVKGQVEPIFKEGKELLRFFATLSINIREGYEIEKGPDGPKEERETMVFYLNFLLD